MLQDLDFFICQFILYNYLFAFVSTIDYLVHPFFDLVFKELDCVIKIKNSFE
jgi:hypothetical protein